jgi:hypothetical protein
MITLAYSHFKYFVNYRCEATGMIAYVFKPTAVVVSGLPNVNDYIGR